MAEACGFPSFNIVAVLALVAVMIGWPIMTVGAAREVFVRDPCLCPGVGKVAGRTLSGVMSVRAIFAVAALAIGLTGVVKGDDLPRFWRVAVAAFSAVMVVREDVFVAALAIGVICVVEGDVCPVVDTVAVGALPSVMIDW